MEDIVLVGFGGHGKSVADCIERQGKFHILGYTDLQQYSDCRYAYLGTDEVLSELYRSGVYSAAVCIGFLGKGAVREIIYDKLKSIGYVLPTIIDPSAIVSETAELGEGTFVGKLAVINAEAKVGKMAIINTKALVEHDCKVGDFTHIAVGAVLCGGVCVEESCLIGAGASILQSVQIKHNTTIGVGAVVVKDIPEKCTAVGSPAKPIKFFN